VWGRGKILAGMWQRKQQLVRDMIHCVVLCCAFDLVGMHVVCNMPVDRWSELTPVLTAC
jgi:hypothetical protein